MKDTLLITGNGFDLALGLESSYQDFFGKIYKSFDKEDKKIELSTLYDNCESLRKEINSCFKDDCWENYIISKDPWNELNNFFSVEFYGHLSGDSNYVITIFNLISFFYNKKRDQHFDLITSLLLLSENTSSRWFEVERNLKNIIHVIYSERFFENMYNIMQYLKKKFSKFPYDTYELFLYNFIFNSNMPKKYRNDQTSIYSYGQDVKKRNNINLVRSDLNEGLKTFAIEFSDFLNDQINTDNYEDRAKELLVRISQATESTISDETTNILNFNYTNFFKDYNAVNIHGSIDNKDIIFGFDENGINDYHNLEYQYTKTYQVMARNVNSIKILNNDINKIIIYGHSLSEADYSYFESIFDYCYIYDKPIEIYFCYPIFHKDDEKTYEAKTELQNAVINLIKNYGNTFDNKDHGKNLLHKLLIENRIHLVGVDQLELSDSSKS